MENYGIVNFEGEAYELQDQAYASNYGTNGGVAYYAEANKVGDDSGDTYKVMWHTTKEWDIACEISPKQEELDRLINKKARGERLYEGEISDLESLSGIIADLRDKHGLDEDEAVIDASDETLACDWDTPYSVELK